MSRVLVAFGSKHGATAEIAERIAEVLRDRGHDAELRAAGDVRDIDGFDAVVLGSAVYQGRWRRDARGLLRRLRRGLNGRPLWMFSSGPYGDAELDPSDRWQFPKGIRRSGDALGARDQVVFGGRVPTDPSNFMERAMAEKTAEEDRDARDFESITAWADGIARGLD